MRYKITHQTEYRYSDPVAICQNQLRMFPRSDAQVVVNESSLSIDPVPDSIERHRDYFGNLVETFAIESLHHRLDVCVTSDVTINPPQDAQSVAPQSWEEIASTISTSRDEKTLAVGEFAFDSPRIGRSEAFADYARRSFASGRSIIDASLDLTKRIYKDFRYDTTATHVNTHVEEAFTLRAGVCQDFAHIELGCLRSLGIPARYVSGYLRTDPPPGKPRLVGSDESHAWISVYAGHDVGWIDMDPTNACLVGLDHIPICVGRDYGDVTPMRGVVLGGGLTTLQVKVDVEPLS
tara:strand:- start:210176 stop:211054 length:879 start_codon:yes stop_codon:yes gene_type:complete